MLEAVAKLAGEYNVVYRLDRSRLCRLAESPLGHLLPLASHRRPPAIRAITAGNRYSDGTTMRRFRAAKIVLNGAIDMARARIGAICVALRRWGADRCCSRTHGNYPEGMRDGETIVTYNSPEHAVRADQDLARGFRERLAIARAGHEMVSTRYSKEAQWQRFEALVASI